MRTRPLPARIALLALSAAGATIVVACGSSSAGPSIASAPAPVTVTATRTVSTAATAQPRASQPAKRATAAATSREGGGRSMTWTMPNEVGQVLQDAQDDLQRASGDPVFFSHSHDLLGDRHQILDQDWQVCTQNVAPGAKLGPTAHVDFGVVKTYEQCP